MSIKNKPEPQRFSQQLLHKVHAFLDVRLAGPATVVLECDGTL